MDTYFNPVLMEWLQNVRTSNLNCLVVRERIPLPNDNKHVLSFKKVYDRLFKDFKDKLVQEYSLMKGSYQQEYELNFQANLADKNNHIKEMQNEIQEKEETIAN